MSIRRSEIAVKSAALNHAVSSALNEFLSGTNSVKHQSKSVSEEECVDYLNEQQKAKMKRRTMIGAEAPCQFSESARNPAERDAEPIPLMRSFKYPSRKNLGAEDKKHLRSVVRRVTYA
eukprot:TRINITY_DN2062_c0_g1_i3.p2 TRINITY_DN2062_c0_g1~~TRINITY_DN2062_c0_g1_i3.p2  ORF type:complete len:119 (-),score=18.96 TRINITY_DN2062_c0_g1_i3:142-498(-)